MTEWSLQGAKNKFYAEFDAAMSCEPQRVIRRGQQAVVVLATEEYECLCRLEQARALTFCELLLDIPQDDGGFERLPLDPRPLSL